jgi:hypothetical protein
MTILYIQGRHTILIGCKGRSASCTGSAGRARRASSFSSPLKVISFTQDYEKKMQKNHIMDFSFGCQEAAGYLTLTALPFNPRNQ